MHTLQRVTHILVIGRVNIRAFVLWLGGRRGRDRLVVRFTLHVISVPITTKSVSSNPAHGEVYSIQHYVIKFVTDLRLVGGFLRVLRFPPPIKLTTTI